MPEPDIRLPLQAATVVRDLILLELDRRGAAPPGVDLTMARSHIRSLTIEELNALRDRLGEDLVVASSAP